MKLSVGIGRLIFLGVLILGLSLAMTPTVGGIAQAGKVLRVGLAEDPDILDPTLARTFVGRIVFASLCDKLYEIDQNLNIVPQLAESLPDIAPDGKSLTIKLRQGVKFHDGTDFNADAAKFSLDRHLTLPGSRRKSEISQLDKVEVVNPFQIRLTLKSPFTPFLAQLSDRAGMMVSPKAAQALGDKFGTQPVCAGPFKFKERVAQDHITVERFNDYWDKDKIFVDQIVYKIIVDPSVRLANLKAGELDLFERVRPTDLKEVRSDPNLVLSSMVGLGYAGLTINIANKNGFDKPSVQLDTPLAKDPRVREALELSIDRKVLNDVVNDGEFIPDCTPIPSVTLYSISLFYPQAIKCLERDVNKAKQLLAQAGVPKPVKFTLLTSNAPDAIREGEVIKSMAAEAGFDITINPVEFASALNQEDAGKYDVFAIGWSGRLDPDGNIYEFKVCGGTLNSTGVCDKKIDAILDQTRAETDKVKRGVLYAQLMDLNGPPDQSFLTRRDIIYLWHGVNFVALNKKVTGFIAVPDGLLRFKGVKLGS
ncbi:ABC transporter substrate-binding protein [Candidatus Acetothermia bacterium]|nr:ABC transporter substrate-binding protein [Candidatus Acetothermia bacterium]